MQYLTRIVVGCLACAMPALAQMTVDEVQVKGNHRISSESIVAFSGLHAGKTATEAQLRSICERLVDSGFFTAANYTYQPKRGGTGMRYDVGFEVAEDPTVTPAVLDIEGVSQAETWQQLAARNPLIGPEMPDNDLAQTVYQKTLEAALSRPDHPFHVQVKREANLQTKRMVVVFRDADRPKLTALQFEGNQGVDTATLEQALHSVVIGEPYSERDLSSIVALNLRRVYDREGYLRATFPKVSRLNPGAPQATAKVTVEEGPC